MKPLIPILIVATTSLAVASVQFARQASSERARADAEMVLRQKSEARIAELERVQRSLRGGLSLATAPADDRPATAGLSAKPAAPNSRVSGPVGRETRGALGDDPGGPPREFGGRVPRMQATPATLKFMRTRVKSSLRRTYEDVGTSLGLSAEKTEQLIDLLADQQTRNMGGPPQPANGQSMQQYFAELQKTNQGEIAALIGQDKLHEWEAYQKTIPQRSQLSQVQSQLDDAGVPMTDSQRTELLAAISEEAERNPRPSYSSGLAPEEAAAQMNEWQTEYDKALMARAKDVLSSEQFKAYKEYQDWQTEMRNSFSNGGGQVSFRARTGVAGGVAMDTAVAVPFISVAPPPPENR
jgi:hypothetical protein